MSHPDSPAASAAAPSNSPEPASASLHSPARPAARVAVIGAGPVGLSLALLLAERCPWLAVTVYDARPAEADVSRDGRTLALALGSVQLLQRLQAWNPHAAQPILEVSVSQQSPALALAAAHPEVRIRARDLNVAQLGAVLSYGALVPPLQAAWQARVAAEPARLASRFGAAVRRIEPRAGGGVVVATADPKTDVGAELLEEDIDLAVVAEGGVFAGAHAAEPWRVQAPRSRGVLQHDYRQTAWVGTVTLTGGTAGLAIERFTRHGPLALLPLLPLLPQPAAADGTSRASIVWCVPTADDPVAPLSAEQRRAVLQTMFPAEAGTITSVSPLKSFALGLRAEPTLVEAGCIVRIGNAAQTLHPVAGQGLNLGLRDAHALCEALRRARREGRSLADAMSRVQWERAPDRWAMIATTDFLARSFTWQAPGLASLRGLGLLAVEHLPGLKGLLARQMMFGRR